MVIDRNKLLELLDDDEDSVKPINNSIKQEQKKKSKDIDTRKEFIIDLHTIPDQMESTWWNILDPVHFTLTSKISLLSSCKVKEGCILIQKLKPESGFILMNYYYVDLDGKVIFMGKKNDSIKSYLKEGLMNYVLKKNKLPYRCKYVQAFKNGNVQIDYEPNNFDHYSLKIGKKRANDLGITDLVEFFMGLKMDESNQPQFVSQIKTDNKNIVKKISEEEAKKRNKQLIEDTQLDTHLKKFNADFGSDKNIKESEIDDDKKKSKEKKDDMDISSLLY